MDRKTTPAHVKAWRRSFVPWLLMLVPVALALLGLAELTVGVYPTPAPGLNISLAPGLNISLATVRNRNDTAAEAVVTVTMPLHDMLALNTQAARLGTEQGSHYSAALRGSATLLVAFLWAAMLVYWGIAMHHFQEAFVGGSFILNEEKVIKDTKNARQYNGNWWTTNRWTRARRATVNTGFQTIALVFLAGGSGVLAVLWLKAPPSLASVASTFPVALFALYKGMIQALLNSDVNGSKDVKDGDAQSTRKGTTNAQRKAEELKPTYRFWEICPSVPIEPAVKEVAEEPPKGDNAT